MTCSPQLVCRLKGGLAAVDGQAGCASQAELMHSVLNVANELCTNAAQTCSTQSHTASHGHAAWLLPSV